MIFTDETTISEWTGWGAYTPSLGIGEIREDVSYIDSAGKEAIAVNIIDIKLKA